jgi:hypothetical protein
LLTLGGMLPPLLNQVWARSPIGTWQTAAFSTLLGLSLPALVLAVVADIIIKWRANPNHNPLVLLGGLPGFALLPLTGLALVAIPALDAHTRLLFGRTLAYQVTEKVSTTRSSLQPSAVS